MPSVILSINELVHLLKVIRDLSLFCLHNTVTGPVSGFEAVRQDEILFMRRIPMRDDAHSIERGDAHGSLPYPFIPSLWTCLWHPCRQIQAFDAMQSRGTY